MSYQEGWAALQLEMPRRVPRTEYSIAEYHFPMIKRVTGLQIHENSTAEEKRTARRAFREAWNFSFNWATLIGDQPFGELRTRMGHAAYAARASDLDKRIHCPFESVEEVLAFDPTAAYGAVERGKARLDFEAQYRANCGLLPNEVNMTGVYTSLMSGLISIFGWDMLLEACGTDPAGFGALTNRYAAWMQGYMEALAEADVPCVMVHDDMVWTSGPFIHPDWYRKYIFPNLKRYFAPIRESGKILMFTSDGDYSLFVDDLVDCGVSGFVMEPMTDMSYIAEKYGRTHSFIGNADTRVLLSGSREAIEAEVKRCMDIGKSCPGFLMAVGNHIPENTPVEACLWYQEAYEKYAIRG